MNIFHTSRLPTGLQQETLARMVRTLLLRLVDDNLGKQPEGEALLKVRGLHKPLRADARSPARPNDPLVLRRSLQKAARALHCVRVCMRSYRERICSYVCIIQHACCMRCMRQCA
jgi:hypothetical protein